MSIPPIGRPATLTRRGFLALSAAAGLSACTTTITQTEGALSTAGRLKVLNWPDYIGDATFAEIHRGLGLGGDFEYDPRYGDTIDFGQVKQALASADGPWDIVTLPNWQAAQVVEAGLAATLPIEVIPNHRNLDPAFMTNAWDRGSRFQMPWQAGITGIAYNKQKVEPVTSIAALFDPANRGRVGFITEMREAVGLTMLLNGADPSRPTKQQAEAALAQIDQAAASGQIGFFGDVDMIDALESGTVDMAMAWSGDATALGPDFEFVVPDEGAIQWFDTMLLSPHSSAVTDAGEFMNLLYDPAVAATLTAQMQFISPVIGVDQVLLDSGGEGAGLVANPIVFPSAQTRSRFYIWGGLGPDAEAALDDRYAANFS